MTEGKREKCQFCENCDLDGHCLAKENYDYFECENDEHFEPIECENDEHFEPIEELIMKIGNYNLPDKVNILGTEYKIKYSTEETDPKMVGADGYCEQHTKEIYINKHLFDGSEKTADDKFMYKGLDILGRKVLRHEIIHAFILESGLWECCEWARNEELTDWIARQFPKMYKVFSELKIADK